MERIQSVEGSALGDAGMSGVLVESQSDASRVWLGRLVGIGFGVLTQVLFLWTAYHLFWFLRGPLPVDGVFPEHARFVAWADTLLALFFAWPHSLLLFPPVQKWIKQRVEPAMMGCIHCVATCVSLLVLFAFWTSSSRVVWQLSGWAETAMLAAFYGSWISLLYSLWLTGMGYQTGLLPWLYWVRRERAPRREFVQRGAFRVMRHPVYLSFLGLIWFTPRMTLDHVILTAVWTAYIYAGSYLKDRRLLRIIGEPYREYARRVPGFPLIGLGIIGKLP